MVPLHIFLKRRVQRFAHMSETVIVFRRFMKDSEHFTVQFSRDFTALGDPNLKPERSIAYDCGIDQSFSRSRKAFRDIFLYAIDRHDRLRKRCPEHRNDRQDHSAVI